MIIELFPKGVSKICQDYLGVCPPTKEEDKKSWQVAANRRNNVQTREGEYLTVRPTRKEELLLNFNFIFDFIFNFTRKPLLPFLPGRPLCHSRFHGGQKNRETNGKTKPNQYNMSKNTNNHSW